MPTLDKIVENLDRNLAILGLVASPIIFFWIRAMGQRTFDEAPVMLFLACAIYLVMRKRLSPLTAPFLSELPAKPLIYLILNILFFALFSYSTISAILSGGLYSRPLAYFISIALMTALLAIDILLPQKGKAYTGFTLLKIILVALSLRWIPQLMFPDLIGADPFAHREFTTSILEAGYIPEGWGYSKLPVFHLIAGSTMLITALDYKFSVMLSICLLEVIGLIFVFLLGSFIYNPRVGLLAALLLGVASKHIQFGFWAAPQTMFACLVPLALYLIFKANKESVTLTSLYLVISAILILTHTIASVSFAALVLLLWFGFGFFKRVNRERFSLPVGFPLFIFFITAMLGWWMYASGHLQTLAGLIKWGFRPAYWAPSEVTLQYKHEVPYYELLLNRLGFLLFFGFAITGSLYMLSRRFGNKHSFALVMGGFALIAVAVFASPLGFTGVLPMRWYFFAEVVIAIPVAIGLFLVYRSFKNNLVKILALTTLISIISFLSITCPVANMDSPIYSKNTAVRHAETESELKATETIRNIRHGEIADISENILSGDFSDIEGLVITRREWITGLYSSAGRTTKLKYDPCQKLDSLKFNHVYESGSVSAFFKQTEPR